MPTFTGTAGDDNLTGGEGDDIITGLAGDDVLIGAGGDDILSGGAGRNYLDGGPGNDTVSYLDATSGVTVSLAATGFQNTGYSTVQLVSINRLIGSQLFGDTLTGSAGDDVIDTGSRVLQTPSQPAAYGFFNSNDVVSGGEGNDRITALGVSNGSILNGEGGDDVIDVGFSGTFNVFATNTTWVAYDGTAIRVNGGDGNDVLTVMGHAVIDGGAGDDVITAGVGAISALTNRGNIEYTSPPGTDTTVRLTGGAGADTFRIWNPVGTAIVTDFDVNEDRLDLSGSTVVTLNYWPVYIGQQGADTIFYSRPNDGSTGINVLYGRLLNVDARSIPTSSYLNNTSSPFAPNGIVQTGAITFFGTAGNDVVTGWSLANGADGDDTITAPAAGGSELSGEGGNDILIGGDGVAFLRGGTGNDRLQGGASNDILRGEDGDDSLRGGAGNDSLDGGAGFDTADYSDAVSAVVVNLAAGQASGGAGSDTLASVEGIIGSAFGDTLTGSTGADTLRGGQGLDLLIGGAGADSFVFAAGDSTGTAIDSIADFQTGSDRLVIQSLVGINLSLVRTNDGGTLVFADHTGPQTVIGVNGTIQAGDVSGSNGLVLRANMVGSDRSDVLIGSSLSDTINGGTGDDFLTGGVGGDVLTGGAGADQFIYVGGPESGLTTGSTDLITDFQTGVDTINLNSALPTSISLNVSDDGVTQVRTGGLAIISLRSVQGSDFLLAGRTNIPVQMYGGDAANLLIGSPADDFIRGGRGGDALAGGAGADVFDYGFSRRVNADQSLTPLVDSTVEAPDNLYDFETGIDRINLTSTLTTTAISIIRSENGSSFVFIDTTLGVSMLITAAGRAINGNDITYGANHGVYMIGSSGADVLTGSSLADPIQGGAGNDTITGGGGADVLFGEGGADTFVYRAASDSTVAAADTIFGFVSGSDRIDLSAVRTGASDTYGIAYLNGGSFLFVDLGGNGTNDMLIQLAGTTLVASDIRWSAGAGELEPMLKEAGPEVLPVSDDVDVSWTGLASHHDDGMLFLDDGGSASARGHDWYL